MTYRKHYNILEGFFMKQSTFSKMMKDINTIYGLEEMLGMNLTDKQKTAVLSKIEQLKQEENQTVENELETLINETTETTEQPNTAAENIEENIDGIKQLTLSDLEEINAEFNNLSKHEKLKRVNHGTSLEIEDILKEYGIYGIFNRKKPRDNTMGIHYIKYALPNFEGLEYNKAYSKLMKTYRTNPKFRETLEKESIGEIITIAGEGGIFLQFIKPDAGNVIKLKGFDGGILEINENNWADEPIGAWSNGGRGIKVFHTIGMMHYLRGYYLQSPSDKFQMEKRNIRNRHWLHFRKNHEDMVGLVTKNGLFKPIPAELKTWSEIIEWAQKNVG